MKSLLVLKWLNLKLISKDNVATKDTFSGNNEKIEWKVKFCYSKPASTPLKFSPDSPMEPTKKKKKITIKEEYIWLTKSYIFKAKNSPFFLSFRGGRCWLDCRESSCSSWATASLWGLGARWARGPSSSSASSAPVWSIVLQSPATGRSRHLLDVACQRDCQNKEWVNRWYIHFSLICTKVLK